MFEEICHTIIGTIDENKFRSQAYIDEFLKECEFFCDAHVFASGEYISGEINLAITIRLITGGDALDPAIVFDTPPPPQGISHQTIEHYE